MSRICHDITGRRRGFTLTELLVAIAIIAVLSTITVVAIRGISKDAKLASGKNTVMAVLDFARARAIKDNRIVLVVFRPRLIDRDEQIVEAVFTEWTGESYYNPAARVIDRFVPIGDAPVRRLSSGIKVAGPSYGTSIFGTQEDDLWVTQAHLPGSDVEGGPLEVPGGLIGVMFAPDGTTITHNSQSDSARTWIDFDGDLQVSSGDTELPPDDPSLDTYFDQQFELDECFVTHAPFVTVYDDAEAREFSGQNWSNTGAGRANYVNELVGPEGYIATYADRIHFNRYTGVAMK